MADEEFSGSSGAEEPMSESGSGEELGSSEEEVSELEWESEEDGDDFEDQGGSSDDDEPGASSDEDPEEATLAQREAAIARARASGALRAQEAMHIDDLSSDDEEAGNTIGNVPLHWYDEFDHIGYGVDGSKIVKSGGQGDRLDMVLAARDDPNYDRTIYDAYNDRHVVLSDREMEVLRRMQAGAFPHPEFNDTPEYIDYYTHEREVMPLSGAREPKRRFVPSKWEAMKVAKIMRGIKEGRIKVGEEARRLKEAQKKPEVYLMWEADGDAIDLTGDGQSRKHAAQHVAAPKMKLPGHAESYRPPDEFLPSAEELAAWEEMDPEERPHDFIPTKYANLRSVPAFPDFVRQRFDRCLDLYLCPRVLKRRLNIDPESLVPQLPKPRELRPYPTTEAVRFDGHAGRVRGIAVGPRGQFLASCGDDQTVRLWEVSTGRCLRVWKLGAPVTSLAWNPSADLHVLAVAFGRYCALIKTGTGSADERDVTEALLASAEAEAPAAAFKARLLVEDGVGEGDSDSHGEKEAEGEGEGEDDDDEEEEEGETLPETVDEDAEAKLGRKQQVVWLPFRATEHGVRLVMRHRAEVTCVQWHGKGDYLASTAPNASGASVLVHQVSKRRSQAPFKKSKGLVQCVAFHPAKPIFFVATQRHVRVYHLSRQMLIKKLTSGAKWISKIAVHRSGDHLVMGTYDRRVCWFDLDLSSMPFKTLKFHTRAVRDIALHDHHPLMATASDDGTVHIFHARVFTDLLTNPLLVPLKILRGHQVDGGLGVMGVAFHPTQPWVFSAGADGSIRLFQDFF